MCASQAVECRSTGSPVTGVFQTLSAGNAGHFLPGRIWPPTRGAAPACADPSCVPATSAPAHRSSSEKRSELRTTPVHQQRRAERTTHVAKADKLDGRHRVPGEQMLLHLLADAVHVFVPE